MKAHSMRHIAIGRLVIITGLALLAGATLVLGFAEEPLRWRDPYTGETGDQYPEISTIHDDLTYAMALAAGFSISDSITLQIWDQLVDSEQIGPGDAVSYTNCSGSFYPTPVPSSVCTTSNYSPVAWPLWNKIQISTTCVTSRYGPYSPFFHFPRQTPQEIGAIHDWAWGLTTTLVGYDAYAWGGLTVLQATCRYTRPVVITTSLTAGSLPAFATYLHSLGDSYSHRECIAALDKMGIPWGTHSLPHLGNIPECDYNSSTANNNDAHGREFYTNSMTDSLRTDAAIRHIYTELVSRSLQREGQYPPTNLNTRLVAITNTPTLSEALYAFVHTWKFDQPTSRRAYADLIARSALMQRNRVYLPVVIRSWP